MRSSQAVLRLCGGLASALLCLAAVVGVLVDVLGRVVHGDVLGTLHFLAECCVLGAGGAAGVFAEIRPHPFVSENAPYLTKLGGRAVFYLFAGMYIIGRKKAGFQSWADFMIGLYTLGVAGAGLFYAQRLSSLPPALSEPALGREMHSTQGPPEGAPPAMMASGP